MRVFVTGLRFAKSGRDQATMNGPWSTVMLDVPRETGLPSLDSKVAQCPLCAKSH